MCIYTCIQIYIYISQHDKNDVRQFFSRMCARKNFIYGWFFGQLFSALLRVSVFFLCNFLKCLFNFPTRPAAAVLTCLRHFFPFFRPLNRSCVFVFSLFLAFKRPGVREQAFLFAAFVFVIFSHFVDFWTDRVSSCFIYFLHFFWHSTGHVSSWIFDFLVDFLKTWPLNTGINGGFAPLL